MKILFTATFLFLAITTFAQNIQNDTSKKGIEVAPAVVKTVADSACNCLNKLDVSKLSTPEQKKNALNDCLRQATKENEAMITADKNADTATDYQAGKQYGIALGKKIRQLLDSNCPNFLLLK